MTEVAIGVVSVLLGVVADRVLGFYFERKAEEEQLSRVRILVALEIDRNLSEVSRVWDEVNRNKEGLDPQLSALGKDLLLARKLVRLPWPHWTRTAWEGQSTLISAALTTSQITQIHQLHTRLDALTAVRDTLARLDVEDRERWFAIATHHGGSVPINQIIGPFDVIAPALWIQYVTTTTEVLDRGNVLEADLDTSTKPSLPAS
ncbi:MAG: hypothetical protein M3P51_08965 [Chloroflexota bacterium]|nr:hypothetical protein [Chloroflexota bacterium]